MTRFFKLGVSLVMFVFLGLSQVNAGIEILRINADGTPEFTPAGLVIPVAACVVLIVGGVASLCVLGAGIRFIRDFLDRDK